MRNNKKIIFEIILISLAIVYLVYELFGKSNTAMKVFFMGISSILSVILIINSLRFIKSKWMLKVLIIITQVGYLFLLYYGVSSTVWIVIFLLCLLVLLINAVYRIVVYFKNIMTGKELLLFNITRSMSYLTSLLIIIMSLVLFKKIK